jgi:hypothetical protein
VAILRNEALEKDLNELLLKRAEVLELEHQIERQHQITICNTSRTIHLSGKRHLDALTDEYKQISRGAETQYPFEGFIKLKNGLVFALWDEQEANQSVPV